jgi:hypothetical protein
LGDFSALSIIEDALLRDHKVVVKPCHRQGISNATDRVLAIPQINESSSEPEGNG